MGYNHYFKHYFNYYFKNILRAGSIIFLCGAAHAVSFLPGAEPSQPNTETARSSITCSGFSISNVSPTDVIVSTNFGYNHVAIQNIDTSANLWCSENPSVTTGASTSAHGWLIQPYAAVNWVIKRFTRWYCISDGATSTNSTVCKGD